MYVLMLNCFTGAMTELTSFSIESMLPLAVGNPDHFYRYSGSLTTPPCYESVVWTIFENAISISEQQVLVLTHWSGALLELLDVHAKERRGSGAVFRLPVGLGQSPVGGPGGEAIEF